MFAINTCIHSYYVLLKRTHFAQVSAGQSVIRITRKAIHERERETISNTFSSKFTVLKYILVRQYLSLGFRQELHKKI